MIQNGQVLYVAYLFITGIIMTLMRMSTNAVLERSGVVHDRGPDYLFSQSHWGAVSYISRVGDEPRSVIESGFIDPWRVFPAKVVKSVDYGIKFGLQAYVVEYEFVDVLMAGSIKAGAIIELYDGDFDEEDANRERRRTLGYYAVRYPRACGPLEAHAA